VATAYVFGVSLFLMLMGALAAPWTASLFLQIFWLMIFLYRKEQSDGVKYFDLFGEG